MLLDIQRVRFKNFYSFGAKWQEITLSEGINLVVGYDRDTARRNGSGKSSLIDAIVFGLFGKTTKKNVTLPRVINWKNKKQCEVHVDFMVGDTSYRIERGMKPNYLKLFKNDVEQDQLSNKTDYQDEIEESVLGIDYDTFMALIYCNPNTQVSIFSTGKAEKRALLETLFGLGDFSTVSRNATEKVNVINKKIQDYEFEMEQNSRSILSLKQQNQTLESKKTVIDTNELTRITRELDLTKQKLKEAGEFTFSLEYLTRVKTKLNTSIRNLSRKIVEPVNKTFDKTSELQATRARFQTKLKKNQEDRNILNTRIVELNKELASIAGERKALPDISTLKDGCDCPTCLTKVSLKKVRTALDKIDSVLNEKHVGIQEYIDNANNVLKDNENVKTFFQEEIAKIEVIMANRKNYLYYMARARQENFYNHLEETERNAKNKSELESIIVSLSNTLNILDERNNSAQRENTNIITQQRENTIEIDRLERLNEDSEKNRKKYLGMRDYAEYIKFLCKDENVKQYAISNIIPYINQQANDYLSQTGFNFYLKLDSFLDVEIKGPGIQNASYGNMSGGESKTINLAVQLALMDVCKMKAPVFPNVLLLDELLDGAVDGPGLAAMVDIIKFKQAQNGLKVFIISHRKEINEFESSKIYQVTKTKGFSTVEEIV